jgi:RNA polymerase-binding protein DksA
VAKTSARKRSGAKKAARPARRPAPARPEKKVRSRTASPARTRPMAAARRVEQRTRARGKDAMSTNQRNGNEREQPAPQPIPEVTTTDAKPRKNQAGLHQRELEHFRELLLARRREILGDMSSMEREALRSATGSNLSNLPIHMADMGTDNYEQEFTLGLVEKDRVQLREINLALAKIQNGMYGICEGTGKPIGKARLEARPWARYSIEYAKKIESGQVRGPANK